MAELENREKINLKGIIVANPATHWKYDTTPSYLPFAYMHNLMSKDTWQTLQENDCVWYFRNVFPGSTSKECMTAYLKFQKDTSRINWYDIYRPVYDYDDGNRLGVSKVGGEDKVYERGVSYAEYTPWMKTEGVAAPMMSANLEDYLNREDVRRALNIPDELPAYEGCVTDSKWRYDLHPDGSFWIFDILLEKNVDALVISGDTDGACPTYGTEQWLNALGREVTSDWNRWLVDKQVGGYTKSWTGITLTTVHGVGHMVPQWARAESLDLINDWIHG